MRKIVKEVLIAVLFMSPILAFGISLINGPDAIGGIDRWNTVGWVITGLYAGAICLFAYGSWKK